MMKHLLLAAIIAHPASAIATRAPARPTHSAATSLSGLSPATLAKMGNYAVWVTLDGVCVETSLLTALQDNLVWELFCDGQRAV